MADAIPHLDLQGFEAVASAPGVTLIDFTARQCAPCRALAGVLSVLAREYAGHARFVAIDVDDEPGLAERFGVRAMPTMVLWRDGREVGRVVGNRPRAFVAGGHPLAPRDRGEPPGVVAREPGDPVAATTLEIRSCHAVPQGRSPGARR